MSANKVLLALFIALGTECTQAQSYRIDWSAVTAGGGTLAGGGFALDGSIGDLSASLQSSAEGYNLEGGVVPGSEILIGPQWILRATNGPPARYGNAIVYDSARGMTVMYGGGIAVPNVGYVGFGEVWEWNGAHWRQRTTYDSSNAWHQDSNGSWVPNYRDTPPARLQHGMAFDSRRGRVVVFGGRSASPAGGDVFFGDTWEWDGLHWELRATNGPASRINASLAYDSSRGVTVLYGGFPGDADKVWEWDGSSWTSIAPTNSPSSNYSQDAVTMAYDSISHEIFLGPTTDGFLTDYFWTWNGVSWTSKGAGFNTLFPSPPHGAMAFDSFHREFVYFGGENNHYGGNTTAFLRAASHPAPWTLLPSGPQTSLFSQQDFINLPSLVAKLNAQADAVSSFLWNQCSLEARQTITDTAATREELISVLVTNLNTLVMGNSIFDATRFSAINLSPETQVLQGLHHLGPDLIRLNRLLLEDAYPLELARSPSQPSGRMNTAMAYDSQRHVLVMMGGLYDPSAFGQLAGNETWELVTLDELAFDAQPLSQSRAPGDNALFSVVAKSRANALLNYQWFFGSQPLNNGGRISGAQSATLQIANVTAGDVGSYHVRVSDTRASAESAAALLTLDPQLHVFNVDLFHLVWGLTNSVLQHSEVVTGNWVNVPGAISPFDVAPLGAGKYFRLRPAE